MEVYTTVIVKIAFAAVKPVLTQNLKVVYLDVTVNIKVGSGGQPSRLRCLQLKVVQIRLACVESSSGRTAANRRIHRH